MFGSAVLNFGVRYLLDTLVDLAPPPGAATGRRRCSRAPSTRRSAPSCSRCRPAWTSPTATGSRSCGSAPGSSSAAWWSPTPRPTGPSPRSTPSRSSGASATSIDRAFPGDVVGLVNANALRVGDSLYVDEPVDLPADPALLARSTSPWSRAKDSSRYKQFRRGIEQLDQEGVVQVLRSDLRGDQAPVLAAVGPMQFEVAEHRMGHEFGAPGDPASASTTPWPGAPTTPPRRR